MSGYLYFASASSGVVGLGIAATSAGTASRVGLIITSCVLALYFVVMLALVIRGGTLRIAYRVPAIGATGNARHLVGLVSVMGGPDPVGLVSVMGGPDPVGLVSVMGGPDQAVASRASVSRRRALFRRP